MHKGTQQHHVFLQAVTITPEATPKTLKLFTHLWVGVFVYLLVPVFVWHATRKSAPRRQES